jgi:hypothetical protein
MRTVEFYKHLFFSLTATLVCLSVILNLVGLSQYYSYTTTFVTATVASIIVTFLQALPVLFSSDKRSRKAVAK